VTVPLMVTGSKRSACRMGRRLNGLSIHSPPWAIPKSSRYSPGEMPAVHMVKLERGQFTWPDGAFLTSRRRGAGPLSQAGQRKMLPPSRSSGGPSVEAQVLRT